MNNETKNEITEAPSVDVETDDTSVSDVGGRESEGDIESIDLAMLKRILEGAVLAAGEPLPLDRMQALFDENDAPSKALLKDALQELQLDCKGRGYELVEVASGWRFQVRDEYAVWINRLWEEKPQKYSRALLETLALIAYRQPLTRGDIEEVRGVTVSSQIIKTLSERDWVKVIGHRDVPGRPALYATTRHFLDYFNLKSLDELPSLGELKDIDNLNQSLDFELAAAGISDNDGDSEGSSEGNSDDESGEQIVKADGIIDESQSTLDLSDNSPDSAEPDTVDSTEQDIIGITEEDPAQNEGLDISDIDAALDEQLDRKSMTDDALSDDEISSNELAEEGLVKDETPVTENLNEDSAEGRTHNE